MQPDEAHEYLVTLRRKVDDHFDAALARQPAQFKCAQGCSSCCHQRFGVFELEARPIRAKLAELSRENPQLRERIRAQVDDPATQDHCVFLVDDRCSVYAARPLICRTHGLPSPREGGFDVCPLNFTDAAPAAPSMLALDRVNQPLAITAQLAGADQRVELARLAAANDDEESV